MIQQLMSSRRFAPLFWAQFCSALNDNVLKNALGIILLYGATEGHGDALVTVALAVFIFPFFMLSGPGGELADRYVKGVVARGVKVVGSGAAALAVSICPYSILSGLLGELADKYVKGVVASRLQLAGIVPAACAARGFCLPPRPRPFVARGLLGLIAALFGAAKYAMLPDQLSA